MIKRNVFMQQGLTIITRVVVYLAAISVIAICAILLPELAREEAVGKANPPAVYPFLIGAWVLALPIFVALHQTLILLKHIDKNTAFSNASVKALQNIKTCTILFGILIVAGAITVISVARIADPTEEVTHIVTLGFIFTFASSIVATFVAVLQRLLKQAIEMKTENELII